MNNEEFPKGNLLLLKCLFIECVYQKPPMRKISFYELLEQSVPKYLAEKQFWPNNLRVFCLLLNN